MPLVVQSLSTYASSASCANSPESLLMAPDSFVAPLSTVACTSFFANGISTQCIPTGPTESVKVTCFNITAATQLPTAVNASFGPYPFIGFDYYNQSASCALSSWGGSYAFNGAGKCVVNPTNNNQSGTFVANSVGTTVNTYLSSSTCGGTAVPATLPSSLSSLTTCQSIPLLGALGFTGYEVAYALNTPTATAAATTTATPKNAAEAARSMTGIAGVFAALALFF